MKSLSFSRVLQNVGDNGVMGITLVALPVKKTIFSFIVWKSHFSDGNDFSPGRRYFRFGDLIETGVPIYSDNRCSAVFGSFCYPNVDSKIKYLWIIFG